MIAMAVTVGGDNGGVVALNEYQVCKDQPTTRNARYTTIIENQKKRRKKSKFMDSTS